MDRGWTPSPGGCIVLQTQQPRGTEVVPDTSELDRPLHEQWVVARVQVEYWPDRKLPERCHVMVALQRPATASERQTGRYSSDTITRFYSGVGVAAEEAFADAVLRLHKERGAEAAKHAAILGKVRGAVG